MSYKVWLDAGHGGKDPGATAYGLKEKDLVLHIILATKDYLDTHYSNVQVELSRSGDYFLSLSERARKANQWKADLFVSVHINAGGGTGFESYTYPGTTGATKRLQQSLHEEILLTMKAFGQVSDRGQKEANLAVVRETSMPAVLTENLFIDRREDVEKLKQPNFIQSVGEAHGRGIAKYLDLNLVDNSIKSSTSKAVKLELNQEQKGQREGKMKMVEFVGEYQMNQLETIYREARQDGLLKDERWEKKVADKSITVGEVAFLDAILVHRLKHYYTIKN
ncbi:N-acetylmuramoyl-L-alanine amidase [Priestia filamentosa]|uniref:N-acetylmuramoyl-L-alanine amidase n=1 Tax=Priestia filamentosa TaxID=1402861 RepID=UPI003F180BF8